jgi:plastocyanin
MRRGAVALALAGALCTSGASALAGGSEPTVVATADDTFFPAAITVPPDTTVNFENRGLIHNVKFEDGAFEQPADPQATPWRVWRRFDAPGVYRFYCEMHGGPGGQGMSGTITVAEGADPRLEGLSVKPRRICDRRTRRCRTTKATVRFTLSEDARVAGGIDPVGAPAGRSGRDVELDGKAGANSFRVLGKRYRPGLYRITLAAEDADGNESDPVFVHFRVKPGRRKR